MATHSSILAWRIPCTEEPGGLQSIGSQSWTQIKQLNMHAYRHGDIFSFLQDNSKLTKGVPRVHLLRTFSNSDQIRVSNSFLFLTVTRLVMSNSLLHHGL